MAEENRADELEFQDMQDSEGQATRLNRDTEDEDFNETLDSDSIDDQLQDSDTY